MSASAKCQPAGMSMVAIRSSVAGGRDGLPSHQGMALIVCGLAAVRALGGGPQQGVRCQAPVP